MLRYISAKFCSAVKAYNVKQEFVHHHTPKQKGHVESFHKTTKKEYVWTRDFESFKDVRDIISYVFDDYNSHKVTLYYRICDTIRIWCYTEGNDKASSPLISLLM